MKTSTIKQVGLLVLMLGGNIVMAQEPEFDNQNKQLLENNSYIDENSNLQIAGNTNITEFIVFPNPANCKLHVRIGIDPTIQSELKIFNPLWQMVYSRNVSGETDMEIDITNYTKGVYYVRLTTEKNDVIVKKINIIP